MSDKKIRLKEQKQDGTYDYLFPATKSDIVDVKGKTLDDVLAETENKIIENNENFTAQLGSMVRNIKQYPRLVGELDDTNRIKRAITDTLEGETLFFPMETSPYLVSDTIEITKQINWVAVGDFAYIGLKDRTVFRFQRLAKKRIQFNRILDGGSISSTYEGFHGWENTNYIGLELVNLKQCRIDVMGVYNFTVGLKTKATSLGDGGYWFNYHYIEELMNNRIQHEFNTDGSSGWQNANYFYNTSYGYQGSTSPFNKAIANRYSILQTVTNGNTYGGNSNFFYNQKFETHGGFGGTMTQIYLVKATQFEFLDYRLETTGKEANEKEAVFDLAMTNSDIVTSHSHSNANIFDGLNPMKIDFINTENIRVSYSEIAKNLNVEFFTLFRENDLQTKYRKANSTWHLLRGYTFRTLQTETLTGEAPNFYRTNDSLLDSGVSIAGSSPLGLYLKDFQIGDEIVVDTIAVSNVQPNIFIKVFDKNEMLMNDGKDGTKNALGYYGYWRDDNKAIYPHASRGQVRFTINSENVGTVLILISGDINGMNIQSNRRGVVFNYSHQPNVWKRNTFHNNVKPNTNLNGYFLPNEVVMNTTIGTGLDIGWQLRYEADLWSWVSLGTQV